MVAMMSLRGYEADFCLPCSHTPKIGFLNSKLLIFKSGAVAWSEGKQLGMQADPRTTSMTTVFRSDLVMKIFVRTVFLFW